MKEHDRVVLTEDLPGGEFRSGDVGVIVHVYHGGQAFEVEFVALDGQTVGMATVEATQVRPVTSRDVIHARTA